jgi:hypothetical protein
MAPNESEEATETTVYMGGRAYRVAVVGNTCTMFPTSQIPEPATTLLLNTNDNARYDTTGNWPMICNCTGFDYPQDDEYYKEMRRIWRRFTLGPEIGPVPRRWLMPQAHRPRLPLRAIIHQPPRWSQPLRKAIPPGVRQIRAAIRRLLLAA